MSLSSYTVLCVLVSFAAAIGPLITLEQWRAESSSNNSPVKLMSNATADLVIAVQSSGIVRAIDVVSGAVRWASLIESESEPTALIVRGQDAFVASPTMMTVFRVSTGESVSANTSLNLQNYSWYESDPDQIYAAAEGESSSILCKIDFRTLAVTKVKVLPERIVAFALVPQQPQKVIVVTTRVVGLISQNGSVIDSITVEYNSLPLVVGSDVYYAFSTNVTVVSHINVFKMRSPDKFPPIAKRGDVAAMVLSGSTLVVTLTANAKGATITAFDVAKKAMAFETLQTNISALGAHAISNNCYFQMDTVGHIWRFNLTSGAVDTVKTPGYGPVTTMKPAAKCLYFSYGWSVYTMCPFKLKLHMQFRGRGNILSIILSPKAKVPTTLAVGSAILGTAYGAVISTISHEFLKAPVNIDLVSSVSTPVTQTDGKLYFGLWREATSVNASNGTDSWVVELESEDISGTPAVLDDKVFFGDYNAIHVVSAAGKFLGRASLAGSCNVPRLHPDAPNVIIQCERGSKLFRITKAMDVQETHQFGARTAGTMTMSDTMLFALDINATLYGIHKQHFTESPANAPNYLVKDAVSAGGTLTGPTFVEPSYLYIGSATASRLFINNATSGRAIGVLHGGPTHDPPFVFGRSVFVSGINGGLFKTPIGEMEKVQHLQVDQAPSPAPLGVPSISPEGIMLFTNIHGIFAVNSVTMQLLWTFDASDCSHPHLNGRMAFGVCEGDVFCVDVRSGDLFLRTSLGKLTYPAYRDNTVFFTPIGLAKEYTSITFPQL